MKVRVFAAVALAAGVVLGTSGCNLLQPQATLIQYDPSDGVSVQLGDIYLDNILVISDNGEEGNLLMAATNATGEDVTLDLGFVSAETLAEGQLVIPNNLKVPTTFGTDKENTVVLGGIATIPGGLLEMAFALPGGEAKTILVPVLTSDLPEYEGLEPQKVTKISK